MDGESILDLSSMESSIRGRGLRKGTHSCVECKRRKVRCFFDRGSLAVCVECQRRGIPCIGQEFIESAVPGDQNLVERLKEVEQRLEKLAGDSSTRSLGIEHVPSPDRSRSQAPPLDGHPQEHHSLSEHRPLQSSYEASAGINAFMRASDNAVEISPPQFVPQLPGSLSPGQATRFILPKYAQTCRLLHAAFPSQKDAQVLFEAGSAAVYLQALCVPYKELFDEGKSQTSATLSELPPIAAHPVILARKLLHLSLCIQQLDPSFDQRTLQNKLDLRSAMHNYYELASSMVTCHDELLDSLEGFECHIYESVYLVNCGNLRRALACLRRASTLAQFVGFHRKAPKRGVLKQLDPKTRVSGEFTWGHIAYLERYISLLLGMPTSITSARFGTTKKLPGQTDTEWFEKTQIDICELIIERNQERDYDPAGLQKIDNILNKVAGNMPAGWWTPMNMHPNTTPDKMMLRVICAQMQIIHYHLLTILHLPYLLQNDKSDHRFDYNRDTCLYASREVLNRFITFRSVVRIVFCCRPVDFCAFTAAMTLLLAHLNENSRGSSNQATHQRIGDRALIERTLETLDELNQINGDELSRETASLTRRLLDLEANTSKVKLSYVYKIDEDERPTLRDLDSNQALYLKIPYFGCIRLMKYESPSQKSLPLESPPAYHYSPVYSSSLQSGHAQQSFSLASLEPVQAFQPPQVPPVESLQMPYSIYHLANNYHGDQSQQSFDLPMPDLMAGPEDWAFQGVDTAFFDNLIGGAGTSSFEQVGQEVEWISN